MSELRGSQKSTRQEPPTDAPRSEMSKWEQQLFEDLLLAPHCLAEVRAVLQPEDFTCSESRELFDAVCALEEQGLTPGVENLLLRIDDLQLQSRITALAEDGQTRTEGRAAEEIAEEITDLLKNVAGSLASQREARRLSALRAGQLTEDELDLNELIAQKRRQQGISLPTDG